MGALHLLDTTPQQHYGTDDVDAARVVATLASIELAQSGRDEDPWGAVNVRHRIGQAQGILMERFKASETVAFLVLRQLSNQVNTKLHLIAGDIVRTGRFPPGLKASSVARDTLAAPWPT